MATVKPSEERILEIAKVVAWSAVNDAEVTVHVCLFHVALIFARNHPDAATRLCAELDAYFCLDSSDGDREAAAEHAEWQRELLALGQAL